MLFAKRKANEQNNSSTPGKERKVNTHKCAHTQKVARAHPRMRLHLQKHKHTKRHFLTKGRATQVPLTSLSTPGKEVLIHVIFYRHMTATKQKINMAITPVIFL